MGETPLSEMYAYMGKTVLEEIISTTTESRKMGNTILTQNLVDEVVETIGGNKKEIAKVLEALVSVILIKASEGYDVRVNGFGIFKLHTTPAHTGRDPRNGNEIQVAARTKVVFKQSKSRKK